MFAFCDNRKLTEHERLEVAQGGIAEPSVVQRLMNGVTHVLHLATCKETPERIIEEA